MKAFFGAGPLDKFGGLRMCVGNKKATVGQSCGLTCGTQSDDCCKRVMMHMYHGILSMETIVATF